MKKLIGLLIIPLLLAAPVLAASLGVSPSHTELEVPGNSSATIDFQVYYFNGDLQISLVDIPLRVEPETIHIEQSSEPVDIQITIYGDNSLGSQVYDGYVRFLGSTGGTVAVAVKVKAKVTNVVEGQLIPQETSPSEESGEVVIPESTSSTTPSLLGLAWYVYAITGIVIGVIIAAVKIIKARRLY